MGLLDSATLTVLGGGPAGLAAAFYAHRAGYPVALLEKSSALGGLCRTLTCGPHRYDTGAHRFHDRDPDITRDLQELMPGRLKAVAKPSKVWLSGRFVEFPPTPLNMLFSGGVWDARRIGFDLVKARWARKKVISFADFAVQRFGRTLAEKFLLNYTSKVWGLAPELLSPAVATRRLGGMSLKTLIAELVTPGRRTSHLDGHFLYPRGGYGGIIEALAAALPKPALKTGHEIVSATVKSSSVEGLILADGREFRVQGLVVSTLPLTFLVRILAAELSDGVIEAAANLQFRDVRLMFLRLNRPSFSENASIYIPDPEFCLSRIYEPRNRCETMAPPGETGIAVEVPCFRGEAIADLSDADLAERVIGELVGLGLLRSTDVLEWRHQMLANAYPVYSLGYEEKVAVVLEALRKFQNLEIVGRNGLFFYSHLHDQMRMAKDFVGSLVGRREAVGD